MDITFYLQYAKDFGKHYDYPEEAINTFLGVMKKIPSSPLASECFAPVKKYMDGELPNFKLLLSDEAGRNICSRLAKECNVSVYTMDFVFYLFYIPHLEKRYEAQGLDKQIFYDSMLDFKCKLWECKKVYNIWGTFVAGWFAGWFAMTRFALGRLQFEYKHKIWAFKRLTSPSGKHAMCWLWQDFVNMHIPSSGPLNHEEVVASYKKAYEFYKHKFPSGKVLFHVGSWLLSPDHKKMFGSDSNIVKYANDFYVFSVTEQKTNEDFWRIYNREYNPKNPDYSGTTTMQKKYAALLSAGGHIKNGSGVFIYDGKEFYK